MTVGCVSFHGYHETAGSVGYHETAGSVGNSVDRKNTNNFNNGVNFKAGEYPYYNQEPKNNHTTLKVVLGAAISAAAVIGGMALAHKYGGKINNESAQKVLNWASPATEKCHSWCSFVKEKGVDCWNWAKGIVSKKH